LFFDRRPADTVLVLLAYDAEVYACSISGSRTIPLSVFYTGYKKTALRPDEIIKSFRVKKAVKGEEADFIKLGARKAQAISKVAGCMRAVIRKSLVLDIAIAFGSVAPVPMRFRETENLLTGRLLTEDIISRAIQTAASEISPIDDIRSTAAYRRHSVGVILKRFLGNCSNRS